MGHVQLTGYLIFVLGVIIYGGTLTDGSGAGELYRGKYIGRLSSRQHKVTGEVYAVDARTIHIRGFTYDGTGPDAFFWTGFTEHPSPQGIIVPNEKGSKNVLGIYNNQDITITLPDGLTLRDVKWFAVWCRAYEVNFGDAYIPSDLEFPQPHVIGALSGQHGVSSGPIVVVDAQTLLVPDFSYDGQAPDVHFWVGKGKPGTDGNRVPDETGGEVPLIKSDKKTIVLTLPGDLTIFDIDYFGIWCRLYYVDFGHVRIPQNINVPPSLKMLGVTPQTKLNCEVLYDRLALEVRWAVAGESIVIQLIGRIEDGNYMSFGLSGDEARSVMVGGDVVLAWFDRPTGRGNVVDYFIDSKAQCSGRAGVCPDSRLKAEGNNVRLLSSAVVNDFTMITFQRPLRAHDELDRTIRTNSSEAVIWAVGSINQRQEASYHSLRNRDDIFIDFGRPPKWNCPAPETDSKSPTTPTSPTQSSYSHLSHVQNEGVPKIQGLQDSQRVTPSPSSPSWRVPPILCHEPEDRVFYAQLGPTGGKRGYSAITGKIGWGIAWYINGLLVPEVYLVRGKTYTFVVEGGENPDIPAKYHPFYITDDPEGGYQHKSPTDKRKARVFAGHSGSGTGRLCQWQENGSQPADSFPSYGAYQRSLSLQCDEGHPGILHWTPDVNTPDIVYYQCYTHRYLGWKIHIVDSCEGDEGTKNIGGSFNVLPSDQLLSRRGESQGESQQYLNARPTYPILTSKITTSLSNQSEINMNEKIQNDATYLERSHLHSSLSGRQEVLNVPLQSGGVTHSQQLIGRPLVHTPQMQVAQPLSTGGFLQYQHPHIQQSESLRQPIAQQRISTGSPTYPDMQRSTVDYYVGSTRNPILAYPVVYNTESRPSPSSSPPLGSEGIKFVLPTGGSWSGSGTGSTGGSPPIESLLNGNNRRPSPVWPQSRQFTKREEMDKRNGRHESSGRKKRLKLNRRPHPESGKEFPGNAISSNSHHHYRHRISDGFSIKERKEEKSNSQKISNPSKFPINSDTKSESTELHILTDIWSQINQPSKTSRKL